MEHALSKDFAKLCINLFRQSPLVILTKNNLNYLLITLCITATTLKRINKNINISMGNSRLTYSLI